MRKLPEGLRRICVVVGASLSIGWVGLLAFGTHFFTREWPMAFIFTVVVAPFLYFAPFLLSHVACWVKEGFADSPDTKG